MYDIKVLNVHLDFANIMTFELHGPWETKNSLHAQMFGQPGEENEFLSVDYAIKYLINRGFQRSVFSKCRDGDFRPQCRLIMCSASTAVLDAGVLEQILTIRSRLPLK